MLEGIYYNGLLAPSIFDSLCFTANWMRKCLFPHLFSLSIQIVVNRSSDWLPTETLWLKRHSSSAQISYIPHALQQKSNQHTDTRPPMRSYNTCAETHMQRFFCFCLMSLLNQKVHWELTRFVAPQFSIADTHANNYCTNNYSVCVHSNSAGLQWALISQAGLHVTSDLCMPTRGEGSCW